MEFPEFEDDDVEIEEDDDVDEDDKYRDVTSLDFGRRSWPAGPFSASEGSNGGLFGFSRTLLLSILLVLFLYENSDESLGFGVLAEIVATIANFTFLKNPNPPKKALNLIRESENYDRAMMLTVYVYLARA